MSIIKDYSNYLKEKKYSKSALETYPISLTKFLNFLNENKINLNNLDNKTLINYKDHLKTKYSPQTVNVKLAAIKSFIKFLNQQENLNIKYNNLKAVKTSNKKNIKEIKNIDKLFSYIDNIAKDKKTKNRDKLLLKIIYYTGARTKDITSIKLKNIKGNSIIIRDKQVATPQKLLMEIKSYSSLIKADSESYLFCSFSPAFNNQKKPPLTEKAVEEIFNKYKISINKNLTIRDLRNSFILKQKTNIPDIHSPALWQEIDSKTDYLNIKNSFLR